MHRPDRQVVVSKHRQPLHRLDRPMACVAPTNCFATGVTHLEHRTPRAAFLPKAAQTVSILSLNPNPSEQVIVSRGVLYAMTRTNGAEVLEVLAHGSLFFVEQVERLGALVRLG